MTVRVAMAEALYGPEGFFRRERPADHFRTSALASPLFAQAVAGLIEQVDAALGHPDGFTIVDIGAGRGELLTALARTTAYELCDGGAPTRPTAYELWAGRARLVGVELADRPSALDQRIEWRHEPPGQVTGVILGCEWLDNVPLDLAEVDDDGTVRYQRPDGSLGDPVTGDDAAWLARWWPIGQPGEVAELGRSRDEAWAAAVSCLRAGLAVAIDYGHLRSARPWAGTLTGFRDGREVPPRFDGSTDITAHVAMDSLARPGDLLLPQREVIHRLGITGARPPLALASSDPAAYLRALGAASAAAELTDPRGLGGHWWLLHEAGMQLGWQA